ncbi:MAG: oligosaccharide flippase family protein [Candidatus Bathyarchaeia archaeon]
MSLLNTLVVAGFGLLIPATIARYLNPFEMGSYSYILWLSTTLALIMSMGLPASLLRFGAEVKSLWGSQAPFWLLRKILLTQLCLTFGWILILVMVVHTKWGRKVVSASEQQWTLVIIGFFAFSLLNILVSYAQSQSHFGRLVLVNAASLFSVFLVSNWIGTFVARVDVFVIVYFVGTLLSAGILIGIYHRGLCMKVAVESSLEETWRRVVKYSLSVAGIMVVDAIVWQRSEVFFLQWFGQPDQIAFYSIAYDLSSKPMGLISRALTPVLLYNFTSLHAASDPRLGEKFKESLHYLALLSFPFAAFIFAFAKPLVRLIYGQQYSSAAPILQVLIAASALGTVAGAGSSLVYALERQNFILISGICLAILNIGADLLLIPSLGAIGAAIANSVTQTLGIVVGTIYLVRILGFKYPFVSIFRSGASCLLMAVTMHAVISLDASVKGYVLAVLIGLAVGGFSLWSMGLRRNGFKVLKVLIGYLQILRALRHQKGMGPGSKGLPTS